MNHLRLQKSLNDDLNLDSGYSSVEEGGQTQFAVTKKKRTRDQSSNIVLPPININQLSGRDSYGGSNYRKFDTQNSYDMH